MAFFKMTPTAVKSAFRKPFTRLYPFQVRPDIPKTRGQVDLRVEDCTFCTLCQKKCPTGAIQMDRKTRVFTLDRFKCIVCGACETACIAKHCIVLKDHYAPPVTKRGAVTWTQAAPPPAAAPPST